MLEIIVLKFCICFKSLTPIDHKKKHTLLLLLRNNEMRDAKLKIISTSPTLEPVEKSIHKLEIGTTYLA